MTVSISTCVNILSRADNSNKCPLKVSLVGVPQESPQVVGVDENAVVSVLVSDYAGQDYNFIVKVAFPHTNSRFASLMNLIQPQRSFVFVVGQMEVIDNEFYIYSKDINYIDDAFSSSKQKAFDDNSSPGVVNTARSRLLSTHRNIAETLKETSERVSYLTGSDSVANERRSDLLSSTISLLDRAPVDRTAGFADLFDDTDGNNSRLKVVNSESTADGVETEGLVRNKRKRKSPVRVKKEKGPVGRPSRSGLRSSNLANSEKE